MAEVNDKIRFLRLYKHWSQEEMAKNLHMTTKGYAKIERGEVDITISKLKQISKVLGVELKELIGLDDKNVFAKRIIFVIEYNGLTESTDYIRCV